MSDGGDPEIFFFLHESVPSAHIIEHQLQLGTMLSVEDMGNVTVPLDMELQSKSFKYCNYPNNRREVVHDTSEAL